MKSAIYTRICPLRLRNREWQVKKEYRSQILARVLVVGVRKPDAIVGNYPNLVSLPPEVAAYQKSNATTGEDEVERSEVWARRVL